MNALPAYEPLATALQTSDFPFSLGQLHGLLCAYICVNEVGRAASFLQSICANKTHPMPDQLKSQLFEVLTHSEYEILALEFGFELLLPDDDQPLSERAEAFREWCVGFLQGLQTCGVKASTCEDIDVRETFTHLEAFAQLDFDEISVSEEDEKSFMEIYEYTKVAVLNIRATYGKSLPPASDAKH